MYIVQVDNEPVLAVDLDGTYILGDVTEDAFIRLLSEKPLKAFYSLLIFLVKGNVGFKSYLAKHVNLQDLEYNHPPEFYKFLREQRTKNRKIVLISASHEQFVQKFKSEIFDHIFGTERINLKGREKSKLLKRLFKEFDYAGNSLVDFEVFEDARTPILVNSSPALTESFKRRFTNGLVFDPKGSTLKSWARLLRPHHWFKNGLVFVPTVLAHQFEMEQLIRCAVLFLAFSIVCSGNYIINDAVDANSDRKHSVKKARPLANGEVSIFAGLAVSVILIVTGLALGFLASELAALSLLAYLVGALFYTLKLKTIPVVDIFGLGGLYILRLIGGASAAEVPLSGWFLIFSLFCFLSLASAKRASELMTQNKSFGRRYQTVDLDFLRIFGISSGVASSLVYLLYLNTDFVKSFYSRPEFLWMMFPLLLYWYATLWLKVCRDANMEDPLVEIIGSKQNWVLLLMFLFLFFLASA